jgi:hypothetical protein
MNGRSHASFSYGFVGSGTKEKSFQGRVLLPHAGTTAAAVQKRQQQRQQQQSISKPTITPAVTPTIPLTNSVVVSTQQDPVESAAAEQNFFLKIVEEIQKSHTIFAQKIEALECAIHTEEEKLSHLRERISNLERLLQATTTTTTTEPSPTSQDS